MQIVRYRDKCGFVFDRPADYTRGEKRYKRLSAVYIVCPETATMRKIDFCEGCNLFCGHSHRIGVKCNSNKQLKLPASYNMTSAEYKKKYPNEEEDESTNN